MGTKRVKGKKKLKSIKSKQVEGIGSKRRLAKLGKEQKKNMKGAAANYLTRSQALKRLQITLKDFRKLCILKGIYPRDPKKKVNGKSKTYYYIKDVMHLAHEPLLEKFREMKTFMKKIRRALGRKQIDDAKRRDEAKPVFELDHIVKERYPQFSDAIADLDDALCLVHLFAIMPSKNGVGAARTAACLRLIREWQNYIAQTKSLTKVFVSIKGIYYQAKVHGQDVTWLVPHQFTPRMDKHVDMSVMTTFLEFYEVFLKFVNFKLYTDLGVCYPPKIDLQLDEAGAQLSALKMESADAESTEEKPESDSEDSDSEDDDVTEQQQRSEERLGELHDALKKIVDDEEDEAEEEAAPDAVEPLEEAFASNELARKLHSERQKEDKHLNLFSGLRFFLSREVPHACMELVIRSFGGVVGWSGKGSPYDEKSEYITHHIMDRPHQGHRYFNREYVQPQWILDSANNGILLPIEKYLPGMSLPPHLSPFVDDEKEGYVPAYRTQLDKLKSAAEVGKSLVHVSDDEEEDEDAEEEYAAGIAAERAGIPYKAAGDDDEESDDEDEEDDDDEEEETKPVKSAKRSLPGKSVESRSTKKARKDQEEKELKELATSMMSKKAKRLYDRMQHGLSKKAAKIEALEAKRRQIEEASE